MKPRIIEKKTEESLEKRLNALAKSFTPDWNPNFTDPDFGSALALIFRDMYAEQIERINQLPSKQRRDIVNLLDPSLQGPTAARGYATFMLNENAVKGQFIDTGFQLLGQNDAEEIHFETTKPLFISDARLQEAFVYEHETGYLSRHKCTEEGIDLPLFEVSPDENVNRVQFTLTDSKWLQIRSGMELKIKVSATHEMDTRRLIEGLCNKKMASWTIGTPYIQGDEGQMELATLPAQESIFLSAFAEEGSDCIRLVLPEKSRINGALTCTLHSIPYFRDIDISSIDLHLTATEVPLSNMLYNDSPVEWSKKQKALVPFGENYSVFDVFMLGDRDLFAKPGAEVTISLKVRTYYKPIEYLGEEPLVRWRNIMHESELREPEPKTVRIGEVIWEYWNGSGWASLRINPEATAIPEKGMWQIVFTCPEDLTPALFGPDESAFIRARITKVENAFSSHGQTAIPLITAGHIQVDTLRQNKTLTYKPETFTYENNLEIHRIDSSQLDERPVSLVKTPDSKLYKAVYLKFSKALENGPIRIEAIPRFTVHDPQRALYKIQFYGIKEGREGWHDIAHEDETDGFILNGLMSFMAPSQMTRIQRFSETGFWLRMIPISESDALFIPMKYGRNLTFRLNSVSVLQQESMSAEYFAPTGIQPFTEIQLSRAPLLTVEVWVNEIGSISQKSLNDITSIAPDRIRTERNRFGEVSGIWVKWMPVSRFEPDTLNFNRIYTLDYEQGVITFGDGKNGKIPQSAANDFIEVKYALGGGESGNLSAGQISKVAMSIPFLERVFNGCAAWGGLNAEWTSKAENRLSNYLRHRNAALSALDVESIIRSSVRDIHDVKVTAEEGGIRISVLPGTFPYQISHFFDIRKRAEKALTESVSSMITHQEKYRIDAPIHIAYSVNMDVVVLSAGEYIRSMSAWKEKLTNYFDPLTGGPLGQGWSIGQLPDHMQVMTDLKHMLSGTERIENVMVQRHIIKGNKRIPIRSKSNASHVDMHHAIPIGGIHDIRIRIEKIK